MPPLVIHDRATLSEAEQVLSCFELMRHQQAGVTFKDNPLMIHNGTFLSAGLQIGRDTIIGVGVQIYGKTVIGRYSATAANDIGTQWKADSEPWGKDRAQRSDKEAAMHTGFSEGFQRAAAACTAQAVGF